MKHNAALISLLIAACGTSSEPGPACTKLLEKIRTNCDKGELDDQARQWCARVAETSATQLSPAERDDAETECDATNRALAEASVPAADERWKRAKVYKFAGALDELVGKPDASTADP